MNLDIKKVGQFLAKSIDTALWRIGCTCGSMCKKEHLYGGNYGRLCARFLFL